MQKVENIDETPAFAKHVLPAVPSSEVYLEDCVKALKRFNDNYFDLAIVDPPYGIDITKQFENANKVGTKSMFKQTKGIVKKDWDAEIPTAEYFDELKRVSKNQIIWGGNYFLDYLGNTKCMLIWDKMNGGNNMADAELAWTSFDKLAKIYKLPTPKDGKIHPTQKPIQLYKWLLHNYTSEGDLILDTHLGSGSIAIACHQMKRKLIGYEIDTEYYQKACKRFEEQTRQTALW